MCKTKIEEVVAYIIDYCNGTKEDDYAYIMYNYNESFFETWEQVYNYIHKMFGENPNIKIDGNISVDDEDDNYIKFNVICNTNKKLIIIGTTYDSRGNDYWHLIIK